MKNLIYEAEYQMEQFDIEDENPFSLYDHFVPRLKEFLVSKPEYCLKHLKE